MGRKGIRGLKDRVGRECYISRGEAILGSGVIQAGSAAEEVTVLQYSVTVEVTVLQAGTQQGDSSRSLSYQEP